MNDDFVIEIQVTDEQIISYMRYLSDQIVQASAALLTKQDRK